MNLIEKMTSCFRNLVVQHVGGVQGGDRAAGSLTDAYQKVFLEEL